MMAEGRHTAVTTPTRTDDLWLRRYRPVAEPSARLVCFPHAGGSASAFLPFSKLMPDTVEVVAVQYPGRQDRYAEPLIDSVDELAAHVAPLLEPLADRPLALFGHSLGSVVAFETARRLERDGLRPAHFFASGRVAPTVVRSITTHLLDDDGIIARMAELQGTDERLLANKELLRLALPAVRNDYRAAAEYTYRPGPPLSCPLTVLTGEEDSHVPYADALAWREMSTGGSAIHSFPGGHFYLIEQAAEVCSVVAEALR